MGYCVRQTDSQFYISAANAAKALNALQQSKQKFAYIDPQEIKDARYLEDAFGGGFSFGQQIKSVCSHCGQPVVDIVNIQFETDKLGDEAEMFRIIAPFVKEGSFIEFMGEDEVPFRWVFDGQTCKEITAKVHWEEY